MKVKGTELSHSPSFATRWNFVGPVDQQIHWFTETTYFGRGHPIVPIFFDICWKKKSGSSETKSSLYLLFVSVFSSKTLSGNCDQVPSSPNTLSVGPRDSLGGVPSSSAPVMQTGSHHIFWNKSQKPIHSSIHIQSVLPNNGSISQLVQDSIIKMSSHGLYTKQRATKKRCLASPKLWQCSLMRFDPSSALPATQATPQAERVLDTVLPPPWSPRSWRVIGWIGGSSFPTTNAGMQYLLWKSSNHPGLQVGPVGLSVACFLFHQSLPDMSVESSCFQWEAPHLPVDTDTQGLGGGSGPRFKFLPPAAVHGG